MCLKNTNYFLLYITLKIILSCFLIYILTLTFQSNVKICDIDDTVKDALKKFRFRKSESNAALIRKYIFAAEKLFRACHLQPFE